MSTNSRTQPQAESRLIARAKDGDEQAFEALFHAYQRRVYLLCARMTGDSSEAEDLTQKTFLQIFRKISTFRVAVIDLRGPLALVEEPSVHLLYDTIRELLEEGARNFAINLAEVPGPDSYTLGALAGAYNMIRQGGGRVKFFAAPEKVVRAFKKFHLDTVLELYANEASAVSNLQ